MRYVLPFCVGVLLTTSAFAANQNKSSTLTDKQIREGWLMLFDGKTTYGWRSKGDVKIKDGMLVLGGTAKTVLESTAAFAGMEFHFDYQGSGKVNLLGKKSPLNQRDMWTRAEIKRGITADPGMSVVCTTIDLQSGKRLGRAGYGSSSRILPGANIRFEVPAGSQLRLRNVKLKPLGTKSIFNGKDLDGWKVLPGYKSKYTVTKEGWLNVKNGRGDIQTTAKYKDFVLQLECISHGKHLNSGIFFRCLPNQYQQGYEAQIRNEATPGQSRAYVLPKYDPQTHKKAGTIKIESTAIDYGTGGIYRRMPARSVVSKDNEWFTLTVVAHGNHLATWVNGVHVADWTDHRAKNDNARRGCCLNAGVISIQGHDPTTNLSFRNFRIAPYPNVKR